jgi:putative transposase
MARRTRCSDGGYVYHVLNRGVGRATIFDKAGDYAAFEKILSEAWERTAMRLLSYVLMPNHWHLVVWPQHDGSLSPYLQWLTVTHVRRWHAHNHTEGTGPIYQGRFKSFPIQQDDHYLMVCRYVERNALRANLVKRAEDWRWSSIWHREQRTQVSWLSAGPIALPAGWTRHVNEPQRESELAALRVSVVRGAPFGDTNWRAQTAEVLGLQSSMRPQGRPKKEKGKLAGNET